MPGNINTTDPPAVEQPTVDIIKDLIWIKKQGLNRKQEKGRKKQRILIVLNGRDGEI